jgi:hypothetical protein
VRQRDGKLQLSDASGTCGPFALPAPDDPAFRRRFRNMLQKIYRARNLLAVCSRTEEGEAEDGFLVPVEVELLRHKGPDQSGEVVQPAAGLRLLRPGEQVSFRVRNRSRLRVDVTLLIVNPQLAIIPFYPGRNEVGKNSLGPGETFQTPTGEVQKPFGRETLVLIATPARLPSLDFRCLAQDSPEACRGTDKSATLKTPLGRLLESALFGLDVRGSRRGETGDCCVRQLSWQIVE